MKGASNIQKVLDFIFREKRDKSKNEKMNNKQLKNTKWK